MSATPGRTVRLRATKGGTVLAIYAAVLLGAAMALPWWRMTNRAPQYGMRVLVVDVSPTGVAGDIKEIDGLGHYVGLRPMETLAKYERALAPFALAFAILCALALPFLRAGRLRAAAAVLVAVVPVGFVLDLWFWQQYAVTHLDPNASMNLIADRVQARLLGSYQVAQFKVHASFQAGFWLALVAAANAAGFLIAERRTRPTTPAAEHAPEKATAPGAAVLAALAVLVCSPLASAETLHVGSGFRFATVGQAVAAAAPGDEVVVHAGIYREHVVVDRPLILRSSESAVIDGGGKGTVVLVRKGPSTIAGFTVRGSGDNLTEEDTGIKLLETSDCTVEGNRVEDALFGIMARSSPRSRIVRNDVVGKDLAIPRQGDGIRLQDAGDSTVDGNTLARSRDFAIWQSNGCSARGNTVRDCRYGLHYMYCDDNVFEDNVFEGNQTGGAIMYSRRLQLRRNRFAGSRGPSAYGLLIKVADDVDAERNWFVDNTSGIFLEDTPSSSRHGCTIKDNVIGGNDVGVTLQPSVVRALFTGNVFVSNRLQVQTLGRTRGEQNVWSKDGRGNWWSDYVGFDSDGDGVGDAPYRLEAFFENLTDRWPAVGLLRMGPAAEALEIAARAFPIVRPRPMLCDNHPLMDSPEDLAQGGGRSGARPALAMGGLLSVLAAMCALWRARRAASGGMA